ncbi:hypothetical protein ALQ48_05388 [Pseudomonas coronafaciens pv. zizaniae]|nr:Uncharacterized protein ALO77_04977 [Pseudomonas coronafaciens pv. garcae]KPZ20740.1 Uncharacterized protein ALO38_04716 [Pseudomonas coronafaciens pv. zizaniae]RMM38545.1 hypothetical protein ALQ80_04920 [Pseudomonas coronafaciens pv. oryzae]RMN29111.1 hypothetical protein ALQ62_05344 [Pseudomonas coronafaciens pv. zizaniae]RMN33152.1 hypothetical protein ALQ61_04620 [Pseudomonas coronafaciens pv. zizaniae]
MEKIFFTRLRIVDIRSARESPSPGVNFMSTGNEQLDVDDEIVVVETDEIEPVVVEPAKTNLSKRRTIDNLLEERRLQRQLADYDFDF